MAGSSLEVRQPPATHDQEPALPGDHQQQGEPGTHLYEWEYQAQGWSRARRVVLVVLERKDELFPHAFWLVTSWSKEQMPAQALLEHYRQRGTAEGHFGELMDVLAPALSSARRPKSKYRGQPPVQRSVSIDAFANNEVRLLLNALAYNLVHAARVLMEQATGEGWGCSVCASGCSK
ncbi:transposase [Archangium violaceum]|uniref:transposase n=1 Tax=Archangium violaceum TaxID=83451 RepID=UPI00193C08B0|nr:transposase [Archangium violaceum]